jgi:hypothetical protein
MGHRELGNEPGWSKLSPSIRRPGTIFETALRMTNSKENLASEEGEESISGNKAPHGQQVAHPADLDSCFRRNDNL